MLSFRIVVCYYSTKCCAYLSFCAIKHFNSLMEINLLIYFLANIILLKNRAIEIYIYLSCLKIIFSSKFVLLLLLFLLDH